MSAKAVITASLLGVLALATLVAACVIPSNWNPIWVLAFLLLLPAPSWVCGTGIDNMSTRQMLANFLAAAFIASTIAFPLVLFHVDTINLTGCLLTVLAMVLVYGSYFAYDALKGGDSGLGF